MIVNSKGAPRTKEENSKTGDILVVFISGVSSKREHRRILFMLQGVGIRSNGIKTTIREF